MGPAVVPWILVQGRVDALPLRLALHLWSPDGCTERARQGRACASTAVATHCVAPRAWLHASRIAQGVALYDL
jgi:hypothetical protein